MFKKLSQKREEGFTIIEVMIVLAIAGLILVVVLIAIPQLQRNQRNTSRQNDASRIATAVSNWSANNNGAIFKAGKTAATVENIDAVKDDIGGLSQYTLVTSGAGKTVDVVAWTTSYTTAKTTVTDISKVAVVTGAKCDTNGVTAQGVQREFVIQYATETSSGTQSQCLAV